MLARVQVEHEVGQRPLQLRSQVPVNRKACAGELDRALHIEHTQLLAQLPVGLGRKAELRRRAPLADFFIVVGRTPHRHRLMRHVGNAGQHGAQLLVDFAGPLFQFVALHAESFGLLHLRGGILPGFLEFGDVF